MLVEIDVNGEKYQRDVPPRMLLVHFLREELSLTGTHIGCETSVCGACTVHINGRVSRSCVFPIAGAEGMEINTIEGLSPDNSHPVQQAWIEMQVPQCGYCQPGMIMAVAGMLKENPEPTDADIDSTITNICRCGTYPRIRKGIHRAAELARKGAE